MIITLNRIRPNPFRHTERYPISEPKIEALRESIRATGFWDNLVARKKGKASAELAYGHHRLEALKREFGGSHEIDLTIRDLDDEQMLKVMARENMEEWGSTTEVIQETVRAVVEAYADGKVQLRKPSSPLNPAAIRYAPSFLAGKVVGRNAADHFPYTATTVAELLGWLKPSGRAKTIVKDAISALELIERKLVKEEDFRELRPYHARAVVVQVRQAEKRHRDKPKRKREQIARTVGEGVAEALREGEVGYREAGKVARKVDPPPKRDQTPDIDKFALSVIRGLDTSVEHLDAIFGNFTDLSLHIAIELASACQRMRQKTEPFEKKLPALERRQQSKLKAVN